MGSLTADARPYTDSDPPTEVCAEQKCCCSWHRPSSSASLHGSYSDQVLQRTTKLSDADTHMFKNISIGGGAKLSSLNHF